MAFTANNPNGQATMANSSPVVLPSDQTINIVDADAFTSGTINAADAVVTAPVGDGTPRTGASTAGSYVVLICPGGDTAWDIQVLGTFGGTTIYWEGSLDSTNGVDGNWYNLNGRQTGVVNTVLGGGTTSGGFYRGNTSGIKYVRARAVGGAGISVAVVMRTSSGVGAIFLNASLPAGSNNIGSVSIASYTPTFRGRVQSFRTPGRAGTAGQKIFALHNATGSTKILHINQIAVDLIQTASMLITQVPPVIRIHRFTALPTNGTALSKVAKDTTLTSSASITAYGDASADGTGSATTLTVTIPVGNMITQEFAARLITGAGYEPFDRETFLEGADVVLRPLEGIVVFLDYTAAAANPITNFWTVGCDWDEV